MTSRRDLDMPAAIIAAVTGIAIVAVALPFTIDAFPQTPKSYEATWGERPLASQALTVPAETGTHRAEVSASDFQPASVRVETTACNDTHNAQVGQQAAMLRLRLTETRAGAAPRLLREASFPCSEASGTGTFTIALGPHADVAGAEANNAETAKRIVWLDAAAGNVTSLTTYTLEISPTRAASTLPVPLPGAALPTSLTATLRLTLNAWDAALNERQEVLR